MWAKYNKETQSVEIIPKLESSPEEAMAQGILPYVEQNASERYYKLGHYEYSIEEDVIVGRRVKSPKDLEELKSTLKREIKGFASEILSKTDWFMIRKAEEDTAVPQEILDYRSEVRRVSNEKEQQVDQMESIQDVIEFDNQVWVETHLVQHFIGDNLPCEYGPDTVEIEVNLSGVYDLWPDDPTAEQSKTFVERIEVTDGN
jgi:hypothetical protein